MFTDEQRQRYDAAAHGMQTGVAFDQANGSKDGEPKHLRVGVNSAMVETAALARLLIAKGVIAEHDYCEAVVSGMEAERGHYEARLRAKYGAAITLA